MKKVITIVIIALVVLGFGFFLFKISPQQTTPPSGDSNPLSDFDTTKTINITEPRPVGAGDYVLGNANAKNTAVVYEDFECPACAAFAPAAEQIPAVLQDTKLVFRHYPLPQHPNSVTSAYAAEAAGTQGKFWEMYKLLYPNQDQWVSLTGTQLIDQFAQYAQQAGVSDINKFKTDMANKIGKDKIQADITEGNSLHIQGTPTLYFNGHLMQLGTIDQIKQQAQALYLK